MDVTEDITAILGRWSEGDREALRELLPVVYPRLRSLAERAMQGERGDHTLQATALVHEAYVRLTEARPPALEDRGHFYALAARLMRRILVDHARALGAARRGGAAVRVALDIEPGHTPPLADLLALDEALEALAARDARKAKVIELRAFAGLEVKEVAELLGVSAPTVIGDTRLARAWLLARIEGGP